MKKRVRNEKPRKQRIHRKKSNTPEASLVIRIELSNPRIARALFASLQPETQKPAGYRTQTKLSLGGSILQLTIEAEDLVALRAGANSFMHFLYASLRSVEAVSVL